MHDNSIKISECGYVNCMRNTLTYSSYSDGLAVMFSALHPVCDRVDDVIYHFMRVFLWVVHIRLVMHVIESTLKNQLQC